MNIPEEARKRYPANQVLMGDGVSFYDVNGSDRVAFTAGAEWARKEALREALATAERWSAPTAPVALAIRALAEGDTNA